VLQIFRPNPKLRFRGKALRSAPTLNQDRAAAAKCLPRQEVAQISAHLNVFAQQSFPIGSDKEYRCSTDLPVSIRTPPLAGGHLAPHGNLCQAENIDILKGKLRVLEILALRRLLCDTIPTQIR
jgi:hypothetical protein